MFRGRSLGVCALLLGLALVIASAARPREADTSTDSLRERLANLEESLNFAEEALAKHADEQMLFRRVEHLAEIDKVRYTGPPPRVVKNPTAQGANNPVILTA